MYIPRTFKPYLINDFFLNNSIYAIKSKLEIVSDIPGNCVRYSRKLCQIFQEIVSDSLGNCVTYSSFNPFTTIHSGNFRRHCHVTSPYITEISVRSTIVTPGSLDPGMHFGVEVKWLNRWGKYRTKQQS